MADPTHPSAPRAFTFAGRKLSGRLVSFNGRSRRRFAVHEFIKRAGGRSEDMAAAPRQLGVQLELIGDDCARQYEDLVKFLDENPKGLLVHPIAGKWNAACEGPSETVVFSRSTNQITVQLNFLESNVDSAQPEPDIPSAPSAAQLATLKLSAFDQAVAKFAGGVAAAQTKIASAQAQIQKAVDAVSTVDDAIGSIRDAVSGVVGTTAAAVGAVINIQTQAEIFEQNVASYVTAAGDIFSASSDAVTSPDAIDTLLGQVVEQSKNVEQVLLDESPTPAGAEEALGSTEELVASCYVIQAALAAERPPVVLFTVKDTTDVVSLARALFPSGNSLAQASVILSLNRIKNPAAILRGTVLRVPSR